MEPPGDTPSQPGLTPRELHQRVAAAVGRQLDEVSGARSLTRWLVDEQLAELHAGRLALTDRGRRIGSQLDQLG